MLMNRFEDQVAVVTGAGRGIGKAVALRLAKEGARIAVVSRTEANAESTANELNALKPDSAIAYAVDVANGESVAELCSRIVKEFGKVNVLVNNAESPGTGSACGCPQRTGTLSSIRISKEPSILFRICSDR
jgi:3-oxoacyl-[acyl-carrier protein] reductase